MHIHAVCPRSLLRSSAGNFTVRCSGSSYSSSSSTDQASPRPIVIRRVQPGNSTPIIQRAPQASTSNSNPRQERAAHVSNQVEQLSRATRPPDRSPPQRVAKYDRLSAENSDAERTFERPPPRRAGERPSDRNRRRRDDDDRPSTSRGGDDLDSAQSELSQDIRKAIQAAAEQFNIPEVGELQTLEQYDRETPRPMPFQPQAATTQGYIRSGQGTATIAGGNHQGVFEDILKRLAEPLQDGVRYAPDLAKRMMKRAYVDFRDARERDQVIAAAESYELKRLAKVGDGVGKASERKETGFAPMGERQRADLVNRYVRGVYDVLNVNKKGKIMQHVARSTLVNGSYRIGKAAVFAKTVESLMPARR